MAELIDTQWDVNLKKQKKKEEAPQELIDTQWDVNFGMANVDVDTEGELIDTQWDVNAPNVSPISIKPVN